MSTIRLARAFSVIGLALLFTGCAGLPEAYPPPANPFLAGASPLASTTLAQPTKVGLVWLAPAGPAIPSQASQQNLVNKLKARFAAGKRLEIVGATMIAAPQGDMLAEVRRTSAFIYPDRATFPPGEVHAVALEQAVNGVIYELDRALGS